MPPVLPVSSPPRVRALLARAADGPVPVLHRGATAVYVEVEGRCVGVVSGAATGVPCALRLAAPALPVPGLEARITGGRLHLDGHPLVVGRLLDVTVPRLPAGHPSGPPEATLTPADVARMVGRGEGLTPYGDDVLCGWLALHRAARVPTPDVDAAVAAHLHRTSRLSAALLDCARHGEVVPQFAAFVAALGGPDEPARTADLLAVGHSSGAGLLAGARRALAGLGRGPVLPLAPARTLEPTGVPA